MQTSKVNYPLVKNTLWSMDMSVNLMKQELRGVSTEGMFL